MDDDEKPDLGFTRVSISNILKKKFWDVFTDVTFGEFPRGKQISFARALEVFVRHMERTPPAKDDLVEFTGHQIFLSRGRGRPLGAKDHIPRKQRSKVPRAVREGHTIAMALEAMIGGHDDWLVHIRKRAIAEGLNWSVVESEARKDFNLDHGGNKNGGTISRNGGGEEASEAGQEAPGAGDGRR